MVLSIMPYPTGERPVGIPEKNGTTFSDQMDQPRGMAFTLFYSFSKFPVEVKISRAMNQFVKSGMANILDGIVGSK